MEEIVISGPETYASVIQQQSRLLKGRSSSQGKKIELVQRGGQLELLETSAESSSTGSILRHRLAVDLFLKQQKSWPAAKQKPLSQAMGRKTRSVIDATAGWGEDALRFCAQGYQVTCLERQPLFALLLEDAMRVLAESSWVEKHTVSVPRVIRGDAVELLGADELVADCVYLDPMFPPKRKSSALTNKRLALLHRMIGEDADADTLVQVSAEHYPRTVVKRPNYAEPLWRKPNEQFGGKLIRYDVYFQTGGRN
ncbi:MAG: class I SAM-dependent methyltransferase [Proteobacteria bacterium]|jgi:16S rRNA (guanine1516-N2)-methyltransferase|nr:class I SAM-dependent methyltransferase [Pseudomonadota bacterium]